MIIPKLDLFNFACEECSAKGKKLAVVSLVAGLAIGATAIYFVKRK